MATATGAVQEGSSGRPSSTQGGSQAQRSSRTRAASGDAQSRSQQATARNATDDEILEIGAGSNDGARPKQLEFDWNAPAAGDQRLSDPEESRSQESGASVPSELGAIFETNPELRRAWEDAIAYREMFPTPDQAQAASARLADLDRMDALFFSGRHEDHAELARAVAALEPTAFKSLARAMAELATNPQQRQEAGTDLRESRSTSQANADSEARLTVPTGRGLTPSESEFLQSANAATVEAVLDAIESQVGRVLPEEISKRARNRVVGEIYRELDAALHSNRELGRQMREAFRSGARDAEHQRAIVSLVAGRARQALPGIAKRVLNEWTSTIVAANHDRRARQRMAERRVDITGSGRTGSEGHRPVTPRDIDYARMSDADILNL